MSWLRRFYFFPRYFSHNDDGDDFAVSSSLFVVSFS